MTAALQPSTLSKSIRQMKDPLYIIPSGFCILLEAARQCYCRPAVIKIWLRTKFFNKATVWHTATGRPNQNIL